MSTKMSDQQAPPEWRTKDMTLAVFLKAKGHSVIRMEVEEGAQVNCFWVFEERDDLVDEVMSFLEGTASVEPHGFNSLYSTMKNDMFRFLRKQGFDTAHWQTK